MSRRPSTLRERIENFFAPVRYTKLERIESETAMCCPADEQAKEPFPVGFFKARTRSGLDGGLGFYCSKCHLLIQCALEPGVSFQHCTRTEVTPPANARMETHQVGFYRR
jgi:hypothetical protein